MGCELRMRCSALLALPSPLEGEGGSRFLRETDEGSGDLSG